MPRDIIRTANAPAPPPTYSQAVRAAGLVFVSGTSPHDPATGKLVGDTIQEAGGPDIALDHSILTQETVPHSSQFYRDEWAGRI